MTVNTRYSDSAGEKGEKKSRLHESSVLLLRKVLSVRITSLQATLRSLNSQRDVLEKEENALSTFPTRRAAYERSLVDFTRSLLDQRRQKSLQLAIELRKRRLLELRATRLRAMREHKEQQLMEEKNDYEVKERRKKEREDKRLSKVINQCRVSFVPCFLHVFAMSSSSRSK